MNKKIINLINDYHENSLQLVLSNKNIKGLLDLIKFKLLVKLICAGNNITQIINFSETITHIYYNNNSITNLDILHPNLIFLGCSNNLITELRNLPMSLKYLHCNNNLITNLDFLPCSLLEL